MQGIGIFFIAFLMLCIYLSTVYIPQNQLTVHRASAKLSHVLRDPRYPFSLVSVYPGPSKNPHPHPYLFIDGHKGSFKQAISMANHFHSSQIDIQIYSIDFSDGEVGLSKELLFAEVNFTTECIKEISERHKGQAITIIGHSFGGIVAALSLSNLNANVVKGIIALGTPFVAHPINSDFFMMNLTYTASKYISESDIFVISITGGIRDQMVPSQLTNVKELNCNNSIHIYSTSINGFHKEIDHVAMVWSREFFEILGSIIKLCENFEGSKLITEVKHLVTSEFSLMVEKVSNESHAFIVVVPKTQKLEQYTGLVLGESIYYILPSNSFESFQSSSKTQKIHKQSLDYSIISLLLGVKIPVKLGENLGTYINPGPQFAEPRLTLRVGILGEGQVQAVLAKCGNEEIIKYNEYDFILYFHEYCKNGPEIWMLGYDDEHEYTVELRIDILATLVSLTRDFRQHIFTSMFYIFLVHLIAEQTNKGLYDPIILSLNAFVLVSLYLFGNFLRNLSFMGSYHSNHYINYGFIDLIYIVVAGGGLFYIFNFLFELSEWANERLKIFSSIFWSFCFSLFWFHWPVFMLYFLITPRNRLIGKICFLCILCTITQQAGWYIAFFNLGNYDYMASIDGYVIVAYLCMLINLRKQNEIKITVELVIASICIGLICQDRIYIIGLVLTLLCMWIILKRKLKLLGSDLLRVINRI